MIKKHKKVIKCIINIIILVVIATGAVFVDRNSRNGIVVSDSGINTEGEIKYVYLENIQSVLNNTPQVGNFVLSGTWDTYGMAGAPLYELNNDYLYSSKTDDGEIVAITKFIQGEYLVDNKHSIVVRLIQDKTFENGGFILTDLARDKTSRAYFYKYKKCYIECNVNSENIDLEMVENFLQELTKIIDENYQEIVEADYTVQ